jgi:hypothetical protein
LRPATTDHFSKVSLLTYYIPIVTYSDDLLYRNRLLMIERELIALNWRLAELQEERTECEATLALVNPEWLADHHARSNAGLSLG